MACLHLTELVFSHAFQGDRVRFGIMPDGHLCSHTAHGVRAPPVTGIDQQAHIGSQKWLLHGDNAPLGKNGSRVGAEL